MAPILRLAQESDASALLRIYAPIVEKTAISFELAPPTVHEFGERIRNTLASHAWIVCEEEGEILGYAYGSKFRPREAYQWTTEVTVYVSPTQQGRGVGYGVYLSLFAALRLQGFCTAIAVIALPNEASVKLHENLGFKPVGVFYRVGYKLGQWHDTGWWQLALQDYPPVPAQLRSASSLAGTAPWRDALATGLPFIKRASVEQESRR